jgi:serine/threonine-protein kinase
MTGYGEEEIPRSIDRYRVRSLMGSGAMGQVFRAYDEELDREVAVKLMNALSCSSRVHQERFLREVRTVGQLRHPNVVVILDYGSLGKRPFLVMELLDGQDFQQLLQQGGSQTPAHCAGWMIQVCHGLEAAHARGVSHRDIKPQNIFLTSTGVVKLLDFGIARTEESDLTAAGQLVGTVDYIAPERILGGWGDHRSDLFAVGVLLHEMLSGAKPFGGKSVTAILRNIVSKPPADLPTDLPRGLGQVILTALAKEPDQRYQTAGELALALEPFQ